MCAPKMIMVDVLCPDCCVPMLTLNNGSALVCGNCETVWTLKRSSLEVDWGTARAMIPRAPSPEDVDAGFKAAMEAPRRPAKARPVKGFV